MKVTFKVVFLLFLLIFATLNLIHFQPSVKAALPWHTETVDSTTIGGDVSSIALDSSGHPHISYDIANGGIKYASWTGTSGGNVVWSREIVSASQAGMNSLALDQNNVPQISYCDGQLQYATKAGSSWISQTVDYSDSEDGRFCSIKSDSSGYPRICYVAGTGDIYVKSASWDGSSWSTQYLDTFGSTGLYWTSLALDSNNNPHACWFNWYTSGIYEADGIGTAWGSKNGVVGGIGPNAGECSIAVDSLNHPYIAYYDLVGDPINDWVGTLKLAIYPGTGTHWSIETVDSAPSTAGWGVGMANSIAVDSLGRPLISYYDSNSHSLKFAWWTGTSWSIETVDSNGNSGNWAGKTSVAVSQDGTVHISYYDSINKHLKYATTQLPNTVTIQAWDASNGWISEPITMDGVSTGYTTPHTFTISGTHTFTIPATDGFGNSFGDWASGELTTTITVSKVGTYTAEYGCYAVRIWAWDVSAGWIGVPITMDGVPTGYNTGHTFTGLTGTHFFTVPSIDLLFKGFGSWDTGETSTTLTVISAGTFTAQYGAYSAVIWAWDALDPHGWVSEPITMDGNPTGYSTPHTFTGISGSHTFTVPTVDVDGRQFSSWDSGETSTTIAVTSGGTHTARYLPSSNVQTWYWNDLTTLKSVAVGDVDGDGKTEVVTGGYYWDGARYCAQLCVWNGATLALEKAKTWYWTDTTLINSVAIGDVTGDGKLEIVTGGYYRDGTRSVAQLCVWNGATLALENVKTWYWTGDTEITSVAVGDVNSDGKAEIVTGGSYNNGLFNAQLCIWDGSTLALEKVNTWYWTSWTFINSVGVGDTNGDGKNEIVTGGAYWDGSRYNAQLCVWDGTTLALKIPAKTWYWTGSTEINSVAVGDVNADGNVEIVTGGSYNDGTRDIAQLCIWNGATLALKVPAKTWYWTSNTQIHSVIVSDVNSDGNVEIVTGGNYNDGTRLNAQLCVWNGATLALENVKTWYWTGDTGINSVAVGDMYGLGKNEIVTGGSYNDGTREVAQLIVWS